MKEYYISFGQKHTHQKGYHYIDKDCLVSVLAETSAQVQAIANLIFGNRWSLIYENKPDMSFFPRGIIYRELGIYREHPAAYIKFVKEQLKGTESRQDQDKRG